VLGSVIRAEALTCEAPSAVLKRAAPCRQHDSRISRRGLGAALKPLGRHLDWRACSGYTRASLRLYAAYALGGRLRQFRGSDDISPIEKPIAASTPIGALHVQLVC
jgi:hypothetical protein